MDDLLTVKEVAAKLRVSIMTVYRLYREGEIEGFTLGRTIRIFKEPFERKYSNASSTQDPSDG